MQVRLIRVGEIITEATLTRTTTCKVGPALEKKLLTIPALAEAQAEDILACISPVAFAATMREERLMLKAEVVDRMAV